MKKYVYRLESPWNNWNEFFCHQFQYTCTRGIDLPYLKGLMRALQLHEDLCGVWYFSDFADAVLCQERDPYPTEDRGRRGAIKLLRGGSGEPLRFCSRIDQACFTRSEVEPDHALKHEYASAHLHLRRFDTQGRQWRTGPLVGKRVPYMVLPDQCVSVFFDGHWYPKCPDLGAKLRQVIIERGTADGFLISPDSESATQKEELILSEPPKDVPGRENTWLSRLWRNLARSDTD